MFNSDDAISKYCIRMVLACAVLIYGKTQVEMPLFAET